VDASAIFMYSIFPELYDSTNISFMTPSKKGSRRFPSADPDPKPIDRDMCVELIVSNIIRNHLLKIASLSLKVVPKLMDRLSNSHQKHREWTSTWAKKLEAVKIVHGLKSKQDAGIFLIKTLLAAPTNVADVKCRGSYSMKKLKADQPMKCTSRNPFDNSNNPFDEDDYLDSWA
jgi:hypothetical protein